MGRLKSGLLVSLALCQMGLAVSAVFSKAAAQEYRRARLLETSKSEMPNANAAGETKRSVTVISFDAQKKPSVSTKWVNAVVDGVCETNPPANGLINGSPSNWTVHDEPRVDVQRCPPTADYSRGYDMLVRLDGQEKVVWKYRITDKTPNGKEDDHRWVIGASKDGVIVYSCRNREIEVVALDGATGAAAPKSIGRRPNVPCGVRSAVYHSNGDAVYAHIGHETTPRQMRGTIDKFPMGKGDSEVVREMPKQMGTGLPAGVEQIVIGDDARYLYLAERLASRFKPWSGLTVYDAQRKRALVERKVYPYGERKIVLGSDGHFAFYYTDCVRQPNLPDRGCRWQPTLDHYRLE